MNIIPLEHKTIAKLIYHSYYNCSFLNKNTDVQFFHQDIKDTIYIAFPGTFSFKDWLRNFSVIPYQDKGYSGDVRLHRGYYLGYRSVSDRLLELVENNKNKKIVIGGHSAGGCLAQIAGVDINYNFRLPVEVVTFGTPACGNLAWQESARSRINNTSYINFGDLIPRLLFWNKQVNQPIINQLIFQKPHNIKNYIKSLNLLKVYRL